MTHRQFLAWQSWLEEQWNVPSLTDRYLMQVACEVRRVLSKNPNEIKAEDFKITFERVEEAEKRKEDDQATDVENTKSVWAMRLSTAQGQSKQRERLRRD